MEFRTRINNIPCICKVIEYHPYIPMYVYGCAPGEAEPPENEIMDFVILDTNGYKAPWLQKHVTPEDEMRLLAEFKNTYSTQLFEEDYEYA